MACAACSRGTDEACVTGTARPRKEKDSGGGVSVMVFGSSVDDTTTGSEYIVVIEVFLALQVCSGGL